MSTKQDKIQEDLQKELQSTEEKTVLDAIHKIKYHGHPKLIPDLLNRWFNSSGEIENALTNLLYSLKDKAVIPVLFEEIDKSKNKDHREKIISILWNAGLEPKNYLVKLIQIAIKGDFLEALECLTVIENMEPPFPEDQLMESQILLKEYFANHPTGDKVSIIRSIVTFIQFTEDTQIDI